MDNNTELFPWVDENGNVKGKIYRKDAHDGSKKLHPVVHLHVFNECGDLFLQHRPKWKDIQPDKWDTACGGHIDYGENVEEALHREVYEELGMTDYHPTFITRYVFESERERELVNVFATTYDGVIKTNDEELNGGRFWTINELEKALGNNILTPNLEGEIELLKHKGWIKGRVRNQHF